MTKTYHIGNLAPLDGFVTIPELQGKVITAINPVYIRKGSAWNGVQMSELETVPSIVINPRDGTVYITCPLNWPDSCTDMDLTLTWKDIDQGQKLSESFVLKGKDR